MDCADYYASHSDSFNLLDDDGLLFPMIDLLPDESKKTELREMREAYALAADFANASTAQNKVWCACQAPGPESRNPHSATTTKI